MADTGRRRRGAELEAAIMAALWAELAEVGYARLTMEGVAARADTGKQVLYRRWRNRAELVIDALRAENGSIADNIPDTGTLRSDVLAVLDWTARRATRIGPDVMHGVMAELPDVEPDAMTIMHGVLTTILKRAADRGEIPTADLPDRVVTLASDLFRHELLLTNRPVEPSAATEIVDGIYLPLLLARTTRQAP
ncbi:MAG TPA: TetR/AcrR family transcriptional regulator [Pseudonocardiaceae bacterium]|jgi:AcrR family transcriptional regulator